MKKTLLLPFSCLFLLSACNDPASEQQAKFQTSIDSLQACHRFECDSMELVLDSLSQRLDSLKVQHETLSSQLKSHHKKQKFSYPKDRFETQIFGDDQSKNESR